MSGAVVDKFKSEVHGATKQQNKSDKLVSCFYPEDGGDIFSRIVSRFVQNSKAL
jgi:hypothetical protein